MANDKKLEFKLGAGIDALPEKVRYAKGSKYDAILEAFKAQPKKYVPVTIEGKDSTYIQTQLMKRIKALKLTNVGAVVANKVCYLEKTPEVKPQKK